MNAAKHENRRQDLRTRDCHRTARSKISLRLQLRGSQLLCGQILLSGILGWSSFAMGVHWLLPSASTYQAPKIDNSVAAHRLETGLLESDEKPGVTTNRHAGLVSHRTR